MMPSKAGKMALASLGILKSTAAQPTRSSNHLGGTLLVDCCVVLSTGELERILHNLVCALCKMGSMCGE